MDTLLQDLRCGFRMLGKSPGFTLVAVLTLALGIGVNTAIFSVINGVLLNPLPYPHPDQLVTLHESKPNFEAGSIPYLNFLDWQKQNRTFSSMAITRDYDFTLTGRDRAQRVHAQFISCDFFRVLGVKPLLGRTFAPGEDRVGAVPVILISAQMWQRSFDSSPNILGNTLTLDGRAYTIVGVIPASFDLAVGGFFRASDIYVPIGQWNNNLLLSRAAGLGIHGIGRLKPGVTLQQAQADMGRVTRDLAIAYPDANKGSGAKLISLQQSTVGQVRPILLLLLAAVAFVLLIACVNVANLLLARSIVRTREFAVRSALGASRLRIARQLLTESFLLALAGGALGLLAAAWGTQAALHALPTALPRAGHVHLDSPVLLFTVAVSLLAGFLFGVVPAAKFSQRRLYPSLQEAGRGSISSRQRSQGIFVVCEMAMALVLLIGAGLMIRSFAALWSVYPGFDSRNVLTFSVGLPSSMLSASPGAIRASLRALENKLASTPGVQAESLLWGSFPLSGDDESLFWLADQPKPASENEMNWSLRYIVSPGYLQAMRIPLVRGRFLTPQDDEHAAHVVVIDTVFARKYFGKADPIGRSINLESAPGQSQAGVDVARIVGVVAHVKQWGLDFDDTSSLQAQLYMPILQMPDAAVRLMPGGLGVVVRSRGAELPLYDALRKSLQSTDRENVIYEPATMNQIISDSIARQRFSSAVLGAFALLALLLASIGIYGVISYLVMQRTHEIGIRMALGADRNHILALVLSRGGKLALAGIALGLFSALLLTRLIAKMLFAITATDPITFAAVSVLLLGVALAACYVPARRATQIEPTTALRYE